MEQFERFNEAIDRLERVLGELKAANEAKDNEIAQLKSTIEDRDIEILQLQEDAEKNNAEKQDIANRIEGLLGRLTQLAGPQDQQGEGRQAEQPQGEQPQWDQQPQQQWQ